MRTRSLLRRLCFGSSGLLLTLALVAPALRGAAEDPDAGRPNFWESEAIARAIEFQVNTKPPVLPIPDLVRLDIVEGDANWSALGEARGRASVLWPGKAVIDGLPLLCASGLPCPPGFPPQWPFSSTAEGERPDAAMPISGREFGDGSTFSGTLLVARAHAARDFVATHAVIKDFQIADRGGFNKAVAGQIAPPLRQAARRLDEEVFKAGAALGGAFRDAVEAFKKTPIGERIPVLISPGFGTGSLIPSFERALTFTVDDSLLRADSIVARTRQEFVDDNEVLVSRGETVLKGVDLFGGLVQLDKVLVSSVARSSGSELTDVAHTVRVTGVTVAGIPGGLSEKGLTFGADGLLAGGQKANIDVSLDNVLGNTGLTLRVVGTDEKVSEGNARSGATGVLVHVDLDANKLPAGMLVFSTLTLGNTGTRAVVPPKLEFDFEAPPPPPVPDIPTQGPPVGPAVPSGPGGVVAPAASFAFQPQASDFVSGPGVLPPTPPRAVTPSETGRGRLVPAELLSGLAANRMELFYGAWTLAALGLALGAKLYLARLLGGASSS